ncbi:hypothetical protein WJX82_002294 [Trebouxia sp. C0006]
MDTSSQPTSRQAASNSRRAGLKRLQVQPPPRHTGHQKQRRSSWDQDNRAQPIILRLSSSDYITNIPDRLTGRALFSIRLMAKQGRLVDVHQNMISDVITVKQLAEYLEPMLTAAAGGSLDAYRL